MWDVAYIRYAIKSFKNTWASWALWAFGEFSRYSTNLPPRGVRASGHLRAQNPTLTARSGAILQNKTKNNIIMTEEEFLQIVDLLPEYTVEGYQATPNEHERALLYTQYPQFVQSLEWLDTDPEIMPDTSSAQYRDMAEEWFHSKGIELHISKGAFYIAALAKGFRVTLIDNGPDVSLTAAEV